MRLGVAFDRFGPYHAARLKAAASHGTVVGVEFSGRDSVYAWDDVKGDLGIERHCVFPTQEAAQVPRRTIRAQIANRLRSLDLDVLAVPGWGSRAARASIEFCLATGLPVVLMSDSTAADKKRSPVVEAAKRIIVGACDAGFVAGQPHSAYLDALGMDSGSIFTGFDVVDNAFFSAGAAYARAEELALRRSLGLPKAYFLVPARFIPEKNVSTILTAYKLYISHQPSAVHWNLVLLGDGPGREQLEQQCTELQIKERVLFAGFRQYDLLPVFYGLANAVILASKKDTWGLVVNEAMAAGLPVLVSRQCGCSTDLVQEGQNGWTFDALSARELAVCMTKISVDADLAAMGTRSRAIIEKWDVSRFATSIWSAAERATLRNRSRRSDSLLSRLFARLLLRFS